MSDLPKDNNSGKTTFFVEALFALRHVFTDSDNCNNGKQTH